MAERVDTQVAVEAKDARITCAEEVIDALKKIDPILLRGQNIDQEEWLEVLEAENEKAVDTIRFLIRKRVQLQVPEGTFELNPEEIAIMMVQWMSVMYHHRHQKRKSGIDALQVIPRFKSIADDIWRTLPEDQKKRIFKNDHIHGDEVPATLQFQSNDQGEFYKIIDEINITGELKEKLIKLWKATRDRYSDHLWGATQKAIELGFIEPQLLSAVIGHDAIEDIKEVAEGRVPLFYEKFYDQVGVSAERRSTLLREGEGIQEIVKGVTKPTKEQYPDSKERNKAYFKILLSSLREDARSVIVKLVDRWHNMSTLDGQKPQKRKEIAEETIDVFVPLAECIGLDTLADELMRLALPYVGNGKLVEDFDAEMEKRTSEIASKPDDTHWLAMKATIKEKIAKKTHIDEKYINVDLQPHKLLKRMRRANADKKIEEVTLADLRLAQNDTIVDVEVFIDDPQARDYEEAKEEILGHAIGIQMDLPGNEWKTSKLSGMKGVYIKTTHTSAYSGFRGKIVIRINTDAHENRSKRGHSSEWGNFTTQESVKQKVNDVLMQAEVAGSNVIQIAREVLLKPLMGIEIFENSDNITEITVSSDTTLSDLRKLCNIPEGKLVFVARSRLLQDWQYGATPIEKEDSKIPAGSVIFWEIPTEGIAAA